MEAYGRIYEHPQALRAEEFWVVDRPDGNGTHVFHSESVAKGYCEDNDISNGPDRVIEYAAYEALEKDWERLNIKCGDYSLENEALEKELKEAREKAIILLATERARSTRLIEALKTIENVAAGITIPFMAREAIRAYEK